MHSTLAKRVIINITGFYLEILFWGGNMVDNFKDREEEGAQHSSRGICYKPALAFNTHIMYMYLHVSNTTRLSNTWSVIKNRAIPV